MITFRNAIYDIEFRQLVLGAAFILAWWAIFFQIDEAVSKENEKLRFVTSDYVLRNPEKFAFSQIIKRVSPKIIGNVNENLAVEIAKNAGLEALRDDEGLDRNNFVIVTSLAGFPDLSIGDFVAQIAKITGAEITEEYVLPWSIGFKLNSGQRFIILLHPVNALVQEYYVFYEEVILGKRASMLPFKFVVPDKNLPGDLFFGGHDKVLLWEDVPIINKMRRSLWNSGQTSGAAPQLFKQIIPCLSKLHTERLSNLVAGAVGAMTNSKATTSSLFNNIKELDKPVLRKKWLEYSVKDSLSRLKKRERFCSSVTIDRTLGQSGKKELSAYCKDQKPDQKSFKKATAERTQCDREITLMMLGMRVNGN